MQFAGAVSRASDLFGEESGQGRQEPWRPIHYLGSKLRALPALEQALDSVVSRGDSVCDLFAGSGTVSARLAHARSVTAVDIQEYSRVLCAALLSPAPASVTGAREALLRSFDDAERGGVIYAAQPLVEFEAMALAEAQAGRPQALADLLEAGSVMTFCERDWARDLTGAFTACKSRLHAQGASAVTSMALRHFGGAYFSFRQAAELDVILDFVHSSPIAVRPTLLAAVLSTASELVNTVGKHFAQPLRPRNKDGSIKQGLYNQASRDRYKATLDVFTDNLAKYVDRRAYPYTNKAVKSDYSDFLQSREFDSAVVYADPPYTRDHYSRFYHVLETLALRDDPTISTNTAHGQTVLSRGVYRQERHQSPFCIRSEAPAAFERLFGGVAKKRIPLIVSYSPYASEKNAHPRVMSMSDITKLAKTYFKNVEVESVGSFFHSRLNRSDLNKEISYEAEYILICKQ